MKAEEVAREIMEIIADNSPFDEVYGDVPGDMLVDLEKKIAQRLAKLTGETLLEPEDDPSLVEVSIYMEERDGRDGFHDYMEMDDFGSPVMDRLQEQLEECHGDGSKYRFLYLSKEDIEFLIVEMKKAVKVAASEEDFMMAGNLQYSIGFLEDAIRGA